MKPVQQQPTGKGDPEIARAWHLKNIGAFDAWQTTQGTHDVAIAVVDSGIDYNNADLASNIVLNAGEIPGNGKDDDGNKYVDDYVGWDFIWSKGLPFDRSGHGTFMASVAAGVEGNGIGSAGVCPKCGIIPVRFLNYDGLGDTEDAIEGIYYAVKRGASVINFSFSGEGYDKDMENAIKYAGDHDVLVVTSASNDESNLDKEAIYPAKFNLPNLITIAASTPDDQLWEGSNWGHKSVHVAAPGENIVGLWFGKWDVGNGTSEAAAVASGAAGLIRSANRQLTAEQTKQVMINTARKVAGMKAKSISEGILDLEAAVRCVTVGKLSCLSRR